MKGAVALISVLVGLAGPVVTGMAASSASGGGSGSGAAHAGSGGSGGGPAHAGGGAGHAGYSAGSAHAAAAHAIAAHITAARLAANVKTITLARVDAAKPKVPPKLSPKRVPSQYAGDLYQPWQIAPFYCVDRDYSLGGLSNSCARSSKSSGKGG